ncbi:divalent metal cation transporter [Actinacidiphila glaucinigra]|uniref:divalent metal cation transporter n=1 Tax=Actinacidiphila glaucinigra TaxID=235986 RepID=UPI0036C8F497
MSWTILVTLWVLSQVALSFGITFALIPLVTLTSRRRVMGALVNRRLRLRTGYWSQG